MVVGGTRSRSAQLWMTFLGVPRWTIIELDYFISPHQWKHRNLRKESSSFDPGRLRAVGRLVPVRNEKMAMVRGESLQFYPPPPPQSPMA